MHTLRVFVAACVLALVGTAALADPIVNVGSRGQKIRSVILKHHGPLRGAVILLAGDNGRLDITAGGTITKLSLNQLVRTRARYQAKGYDTLVPDLAPDMKIGSSDVVSGYRVSRDYARDIGAMVGYLRRRGSDVVVVIGTSRGSGGAGNAVAKLTGTARPDAAVYTSAYLTLDCSDIINLWCLTNDKPRRLNVPSLVVRHVQDKCEDTPPTAVAPFAAWWEEGTRLRLTRRSFTGGAPPQSGPCDAQSPHGFWGLDPQVVNAITDWIGRLR